MQSTATAVSAATAPELAAHEAVFLSSCAPQAVDTAPEAGPDAVAAHAVDPATAERLWAWTAAVPAETLCRGGRG